MDRNQFAESIKQKYPQYANIDNETLATKMLEKYPEYASRIKEPNLYEQMVSGVKNIGKTLVSDIKTSYKAQTEGQAPLSTGLQYAGAIAKVPLSVAGGVIGKGLETVGLDKPVQAIGEAINKPIQAIGEAVGDIKGIQNIAMSSIGENTQRNVESIKNITDLAGLIAGLKTTPKVAGRVKGTVESVIPKPMTPEQAIQLVKENLTEQIEGKKSLTTKLDKTRTDVVDTIASNPKYHPQIDVENKSFNTQLAQNAVKNDVTSYSEQLKRLFSYADETQPPVKIADVSKNVQDILFSPKNGSTFVVAGKTPFKEIQDILNRAKTVYGETIPRTEIWEIRKQIDNNIEQIADTNVKKGLRQDLRKAFASSLEESITEGKGLVQGAMSELQKIIEARDYLKDLNATKIQGGKLTDLIRNATSGAVGQSIGTGIGGVLGGVGGAVGGFVISKKIGDWLAKNTLSSAKSRKALETFIQNRPDVLKDIEDYIKGLPKDEMDNAIQNLDILKIR